MLDEHLQLVELVQRIASWYPGSVTSITEFRRGSLIRDEAVPSLLRQARQPTFVTINVRDFWGRAPADPRCCILCVDVPDERITELPDLVRRALRLPLLRTKAGRCGRVVRVSSAGIWYYGTGTRQPEFEAWPAG